MGMSAKGPLNVAKKLGVSWAGLQLLVLQIEAVNPFKDMGDLYATWLHHPAAAKRQQRSKKKRNGTNNGGEISKIRPGNRENHEKTEIELAKGGSY